MTGLLVLSVAVLWIVAAVFLCKWVMRLVPIQRGRVALAIALFLLVLPLPLIDEIVGGWQFAQLCEESRDVRVDASKAAGRQVMLRQLPIATAPRFKSIPRRDVSGTMVPIREDLWEYVDVQTGDTLVSYKIYEAKGGWLSRALGVLEGRGPFTFRGYCAPKERSTVFAELGITRLNEKSLKPERAIEIRYVS